MGFLQNGWFDTLLARYYTITSIFLKFKKIKYRENNPLNPLLVWWFCKPWQFYSPHIICLLSYLKKSKKNRHIFINNLTLKRVIPKGRLFVHLVLDWTIYVRTYRLKIVDQIKCMIYYVSDYHDKAIKLINTQWLTVLSRRLLKLLIV